MVTLEKLFYQHQYKPLELSTYLSDYLREARSCSFRPEACSKRLYQLFHRFVKKFSSFQDPSLSHLILSISFSVLTYLCETSRDSFATFFEFGLATLLLEELPLSDMTQNENTFSEFISLLHLLCDSYAQTELAQLCHFIVPLLDTILRPSTSSRTHMQVSSLIIKLCDSLSPCVVMRLKSDRSFSTQIVKTGKRIGALGDIFLQSDVVESIFRLTSKTERAKLSDILFSCPSVSTAFREISEDAFERGSRRFLNKLNASLASTCKVFSYPCVDGALDETVLSRPQELEHLWADFNTSSQNLTLFISHPLDPSSTEWVTVFLRRESFTQLSLASSGDGFQLLGAVSSDKSEICEVLPRSSSSVALRLSFRREHDPSLGMAAALGYTGTSLHLPATPDVSKKPPPVRASTSMQAIRILTDPSGTLSTLVAPNNTPVQLEESVSPILRSIHEGTRPSVPLTQQTTPVAPIPPIDPLTSTPIRKNISTPVFTPNNIVSVREQTECVLASASSLHSSARISIPGSGQRCELPNRFVSTNSRKFTPSSLATHVNTPVDIVAVGENSEVKIDAQRANSVKHEIEKGEESLERRITTVTPQSNTNGSNNDKTRFPDSNTRSTTPRSIRMSSCRRGRHEISRSYKPRAAKVPKKVLTPPSKINAPTPMSVDPVTPPIESNEPIQISSNSSSPLNHNTQKANTTKTLSVSILPIDLTNSEDSANSSPSPVSVGSKKLALSASSLSYQILSPVLMQGKYRRIKPRDTPAQNEIETEERNEKKATRVTQTRPPTKQKLSPPVKHRPPRQRSRKFSPIFTSEDSNSPIRKYALTRSQSRNCHLKSPQNQKNDLSGIQGGYIFPAQSFEKTASNNRNSRRSRKRDSPKITLVSDFPAKCNYKQLSRDSIGSISSSSLLQLQTKNAPLPIRSFSFKSDNSNSSDRMNSLEKHLQQYEENLKLFSHSLVAIDRSRSERVKKLFVEMKQLMGNENRDVLNKYNDWYHETRNLVAAISEMRQFDLESKSDLHKQFQQAVKQMEHSIQKEQVSAIKKRIHSFFIKI